MRAAVLRLYSLSYRDLEEMMAERALSVDHVAVFRWRAHSESAASPRAVAAESIGEWTKRISGLPADEDLVAGIRRHRQARAVRQ